MKRNIFSHVNNLQRIKDCNETNQLKQDFTT